MRRLWIVAATVVACAGLAGQASIAYAESGNTHAATSCSDVTRRYTAYSNAQRNALGRGSPSSIRKYFANLAKTYNKLASSGPTQLRAAFKHLAQYMAQVARIDFSNPSSVQQQGQQLAASAQRLRPDLQKIAAYLGTVCHYTSTTT
jgi:type VI protein secretion system component VasK